MPWRPTPPRDLAAYLNRTRQRSVLVVNQLTQDLNSALRGLQAEAAAGVNVEFVEMGNASLSLSIAAKSLKPAGRGS